MGLFSRRTRVSADSLAVELSKLVLTDALFGPHSLDARIRAIGGAPTIPSDQYFLEIVIASLFPFDLMLHLDHGARADRVRAQLREIVLAGVNSMRTDVGASAMNSGGWEEIVSERLREYAGGIDGGANGFEQFGLSASRHICAPARADPGVALAVGIKFAGAFKHMRPVFKDYDIAPQ